MQFWIFMLILFWILVYVLLLDGEILLLLLLFYFDPSKMKSWFQLGKNHR